jgi:tRNA (adenine22-N1)-methyltransferase
MTSLSKRLATIAEQVLSNLPIADIGTDHASLPIYLVEQSIVPYAIASDLHQGPIAAATQHVQSSGLQAHISVRAGDGLAVLKPNEVSTIVIAGMGGGTMTSILASGQLEWLRVKRLVLQPNMGEHLVREWLWREGWKLMNEQLVEEDGIIYEIFTADAADRPDAEQWNEQLYTHKLACDIDVSLSTRLLLGPTHLSQPTDIFIKKWQHFLLKQDRLIHEIDKSTKASSLSRSQFFRQQFEEVQEVLRCLSKFVK